MVQDDYNQLSEREYKVRLIEQLGNLESKLSNNFNAPAQNENSFCNFSLDRIENKMLELVCKEYTCKVLKMLLA